ncbi:MAG: LytTR family transcriptional regulator DNA-binding domain-containing protein [Pseudomonadota bacterium]
MITDFGKFTKGSTRKKGNQLNRIQTIRSHTNGEYFLTLDGMKDVKVSRSYRDRIKEIATNRI